MLQEVQRRGDLTDNPRSERAGSAALPVRLEREMCAASPARWDRGWGGIGASGLTELSSRCSLVGLMGW